MEEPGRDYLLSNAKYLEQFHEEHLNESYVASFSENRDDLNQWRAYCPPGQGVCIGFKSSILIKAINAVSRKDSSYKWSPSRPRLAKVLYVDETYGANFDAAIMRILDGVPWPSEHRDYSTIPNLMINDSVVYKHPAFKEECEWRAVLGVPKLTGRHKAKFRVGKSHLVPYVGINLSQADTAFVSEVIVGPSPNIGLSVSSIKRLMSQNRRSFGNAEVEASSIPYRHW